jgi:hypothetical protein
MIGRAISRQLLRMLPRYKKRVSIPELLLYCTPLGVAGHATDSVPFSPISRPKVQKTELYPVEKTEALQSLEILAWWKAPCSITHWREAVIENPNFMQEEYDHLVKYSAIPEEVHTAYSDELTKALAPLDKLLWDMAPSKGLIYMVQHPEYQKEWDFNWNKRQKLQANQRPERLKIHRRLHRKYYHEYGIAFNENLWTL